MASKTVSANSDVKIDGRSGQKLIERAARRVLNEREKPGVEKRLVRILRAVADKAEGGDTRATDLLLDRAFGKQASVREITYEGSVKMGPDAAFVEILENMGKRLPPPTIDVTPDDKG